DGKLYFSTGDSAHTPLDDVPTPVTDPDNQAQDPRTRFGKLQDRRRQRAVARGDRRLRAPEPLAVLVRQRDRRALPRRPRLSPLGGGRRPARPPSWALQLRLERLRGERTVHRPRR